MKKFIYSIILGSCLSLASCSDYLDVSSELASNLSLEDVFVNVNYTKQWHANIFNLTPDYTNIFRATSTGNPWAILCGEIATNWDTGKTIMLNGFNASNAAYHRFGSTYQYIRQAQIFLEHVQPIGATSDQASLSQEQVDRMKSEAEFFIAFGYFSLFEVYGPVPIITAAEDPGKSSFDYPRATVDEMVGYIDGLLQKVLDDDKLPKTLLRTGSDGKVTYNMNEMVRPTRAVVLALRAKLWVYAASKLFNGGYQEALKLTNPNGNRIFPDANPEKWKTAKHHLEAFLNFAKDNGFDLLRVYKKGAGGAPDTYDPNESVYQIFQDYNEEIIWASSVSQYIHVDNSEGCHRARPTDLNDGYSGLGVAQGYVDAFFTKNGLDIKDGDPDYNETGFTDIENPCAYNKPQVDKNVFNMYVNREPRFYNAITYQGKSWHIQKTAGWQVNFAKGRNNANEIAFREHYTGYLLYKWVSHDTFYQGDWSRNHACPSIIFRLADFYLYYAEVCNEIDPSDANIIKYLDLVRERAGIPGYREMQNKGTKTGVIGNYEKQAYAIRRERQVELFAEGQRYFDVRRWMICDPGEEADQTQFWGMNVDGYDVKKIKDDYTPKPLGDPDSFYQRKSVRKNQWVRAMYLYPLPHNEIMKSPNMVQNPLW